jgi:hypothetical protein
MSDGNKLFIQLYPTSAYLNAYKSSMNDIVHSGLVNLSGCSIDVTEVFILKALLRIFLLIDMI